MNKRSGWWTFLLFLLLLAMIVLQVLSMIQSDRLFERLNILLEQTSGRGVYEKPVSHQTQSANLPMPKYPGDEGDWLVWQLGAEPRTLNTLTVEAETATRYITGGYIFETNIRI